MGTLAPKLARDADDEASLASLLEPDLGVGRYILGGQIGSGSMGVVYGAHDPQLDRKVAIKFFRPRGSDTAQLRERALSEGQALAQMSHPNVVSIYDVGEYEGHVYLVMDLVEGWNLSEWTQATSPSFRQKLDALLQAGRGLLAAHRQGLVHRDFKPGNVLIGLDGVAKVADFGLVARTAIRSGLESTTIDTSAVEESQAALDTRRVGTPKYMAPEQYLGRATDARSDQFSFCVTAYELLFGVHPFEGDNAAALQAQILAGNVRMPPSGSRGASRIARVLKRGMAAEPEERFETMEVLLRKLAPRSGRLWLVGSSGAAMLGLGVALGLSSASAPCEEIARVEAEGLWNDEVAHDIDSAFAATGASYAETAAASTTRELRRYVERWTKQRRVACELQREGEPDAVARSRQLGCFALRSRQLSTLVETLRTADEEVVGHAVSSVLRLPSPELCLDVARLQSDLPLPDDEVVAARVDELRERLAQLDALLYAGKLDAARILLDDITAQANDVGYDPLTAEVWLRRGRVVYLAEGPRPAIDIYEKTLDEAMAASHDGVEIDAALLLARQHGSLLDAEKAERNLRHAKAVAQRTGRARDRELDFLQAEGLVAFARGDFTASARIIGRAVEKLGDSPEHRRLRPIILGNLGSAHAAANQSEAALAAYRESAALRTELVGIRHFDNAKAFHNIGMVEESLGRLEAAQRDFELAHEIFEEAEHPFRHVTRQGLALVLLDRNQPRAALEHLEEILPEFVALYGPDHLHVATIHHQIGGAFVSLGESERARGHIESSVEQLTRVAGRDHQEYAEALIQLGRLELAENHLEDAERVFEEARQILAEKLGTQHQRQGEIGFLLARVALARGQRDLALDRLERAQALADATVPLTRTRILRSLAQLMRSTDPSRARDLLTEAERLATAAGINPEVVKELAAERARLGPSRPTP